MATKKKNNWYKVTWLERHDLWEGDGPVIRWVPQAVDIIAPDSAHARNIFRTRLREPVPITHLHLARMGTEQQYLENQGQLEINFHSDPEFEQFW